jgi:hypothetical protein
MSMPSSSVRSAFSVKGLWCRVQDSVFGAQGSLFGVRSSELRVKRAGFRV